MGNSSSTGAETFAVPYLDAKKTPHALEKEILANLLTREEFVRSVSLRDAANFHLLAAVHREMNPELEAVGPAFWGDFTVQTWLSVDTDVESDGKEIGDVVDESGALVQKNLFVMKGDVDHFLRYDDDPVHQSFVVRDRCLGLEAPGRSTSTTMSQSMQMKFLTEHRRALLGRRSRRARESDEHSSRSESTSHVRGLSWQNPSGRIEGLQHSTSSGFDELRYVGSSGTQTKKPAPFQLRIADNSVIYHCGGVPIPQGAVIAKDRMLPLRGEVYQSLLAKQNEGAEDEETFLARFHAEAAELEKLEEAGTRDAWMTRDEMLGGAMAHTAIFEAPAAKLPRTALDGVAETLNNTADSGKFLFVDCLTASCKPNCCVFLSFDSELGGTVTACVAALRDILPGEPLTYIGLLPTVPDAQLRDFGNTPGVKLDHLKHVCQRLNAFSGSNRIPAMVQPYKDVGFGSKALTEAAIARIAEDREADIQLNLFECPCAYCARAAAEIREQALAGTEYSPSAVSFATDTKDSNSGEDSILSPRISSPVNRAQQKKRIGTLAGKVEDDAEEKRSTCCFPAVPNETHSIHECFHVANVARHAKGPEFLTRSLKRAAYRVPLERSALGDTIGKNGSIILTPRDPRGRRRRDEILVWVAAEPQLPGGKDRKESTSNSGLFQKLEAQCSDVRADLMWAERAKRELVFALRAFQGVAERADEQRKGLRAPIHLHPRHSLRLSAQQSRDRVDEVRSNLAALRAAAWQGALEAAMCVLQALEWIQILVEKRTDLLKSQKRVSLRKPSLLGDELTSLVSMSEHKRKQDRIDREHDREMAKAGMDTEKIKADFGQSVEDSAALIAEKQLYTTGVDRINRYLQDHTDAYVTTHSPLRQAQATAGSLLRTLVGNS